MTFRNARNGAGGLGAVTTATLERRNVNRSAISKSDVKSLNYDRLNLAEAPKSWRFGRVVLYRRTTKKVSPKVSRKTERLAGGLSASLSA